jgi:TorA maturation chaperone TorD
MEMPMSEISRTTAVEIDSALGRSVLYEALAVGFHPPGPETLQRLGTTAAVRPLAAAAALVDPSGEAGLACAALQLGGTADAGHAAPLEESYRQLFGHTTRGSLSAYETEYGEDTAFQQPQQLGDLSGFFGAFGLRLNERQRERVDHVAVECEFMAFLARKEAYALEQNEQAMLETTRHAEKLFLRDHLGRFAPAFGRLAAAQDPRGFYGALGNLCSRFVPLECARFGVPAGPEFLPLRRPEPDATPMACGNADDLIQVRDSSAVEGEGS